MGGNPQSKVGWEGEGLGGRRKHRLLILPVVGVRRFLVSPNRVRNAQRLSGALAQDWCRGHEACKVRELRRFSLPPTSRVPLPRMHRTC